MTSDGEQFLMYLLAFCISSWRKVYSGPLLILWVAGGWGFFDGSVSFCILSLEKCLFRPFAHLGVAGGFLDGSVGKNLPAMQETQEIQVRSLVWEDVLEEEDGNPLQYSCLKNLMSRGV